MATSPSFQFYANDFITGTQDWSIEEVGIYIRLLCYQWDKGSLPIEEKRLSRICGCDLDSFKKAWVYVGLKFLDKNNNTLQNERLEQIRQQQLEYREKQRLNGLKGGRPKNIEAKNNPLVNPNKSQTITQTKPLQSSIRYINISFNNFWDLYDKKVGDKNKAEKMWNKLKDQDRESIMKYIPKYILSQPEKKFRLHPTSFLNQNGWESELIISNNINDKKWHPSQGSAN
jgi:uncharacterized protein YdaU (DUF1376 family)